MTLAKNRDEILIELGGLQPYKAYKSKLGSASAMSVAQLLILEELKCQDATGRYSPGKTTQERSRIDLTPQSVFKLKNEAQKTELLQRLAITMEGELQKLVSRGRLIHDLFTGVANGQLSEMMSARKANVEPEEHYYAAPRAVPEPAELDKAKAWLKFGVSGDKSAYDQVFQKYLAKDEKAFPGADEKILSKIWLKLVPGAPPHRLPSLDTPYPSSFAGMYHFRQLLDTHKSLRMPPLGLNPKIWESLALYWFATVMCLQPFPDGNKRVARAVYAILIAKAGIPFRAPSQAFGAQLARM